MAIVGLRVGLIGEAQTEVTTSNTADSMGSGTLPVFATPALIALMEGAATEALKEILMEEQSSVGIQVNIEHLSATPVGEKVTAFAEITRVDGRHVIFEVRAWDERELIGQGEHTRFIIDIERFMQRIEENT